MKPGAASPSQSRSCRSAALRVALSKLSAASSVRYTVSTGMGAAGVAASASASILRQGQTMGIVSIFCRGGGVLSRLPCRRGHPAILKVEAGRQGAVAAGAPGGAPLRLLSRVPAAPLGMHRQPPLPGRPWTAAGRRTCLRAGPQLARRAGAERRPEDAFHGDRMPMVRPAPCRKAHDARASVSLEAWLVHSDAAHLSTKRSERAEWRAACQPPNMASRRRCRRHASRGPRPYIDQGWLWPAMIVQGCMCYAMNLF